MRRRWRGRGGAAGLRRGATPADDGRSDGAAGAVVEAADEGIAAGGGEQRPAPCRQTPAGQGQPAAGPTAKQPEREGAPARHWAGATPEPPARRRGSGSRPQPQVPPLRVADGLFAPALHGQARAIQRQVVQRREAAAFTGRRFLESSRAPAAAVRAPHVRPERVQPPVNKRHLLGSRRCRGIV
eukprot:scaffold9425_cov99-Isochrysis_galbana.AAC.5